MTWVDLSAGIYLTQVDSCLRSLLVIFPLLFLGVGKTGSIQRGGRLSIRGETSSSHAETGEFLSLVQNEKPSSPSLDRIDEPLESPSKPSS